MEVRQMRDRAPYAQWVRDGYMQAVPGQVVDYEWVFGWLRQRFEDMGCVPHSVNFDRWRISEARSAADSAGFSVQEWVEVGQGFQSMSPRMEFFETMLLQGRIRHGNHPLLNLAASHCIAQADPAGNRKPAKNKSTQRIDPIVAAIMAAGAFMTPPQEFDVSSFIA
jgi:phage terminase large subunit-like protein